MTEDGKRFFQDLSLGFGVGVAVGLAAILVVLLSNVIGVVRYARGEPISGVARLCDCAALMSTDPVKIPGGVFIPETGEKLTYGEITWADTAAWLRCPYGEHEPKPLRKLTGDTRCLIAPTPRS